MAGFTRHVFVCLNHRDPSHPKGSCKQRGSDAVLACMKARIAQLGLQKSIRINQAGCMEHCEHGPSVVVYPDAVWYRIPTVEDAREMVDSHVVGGAIVDRLLIDGTVARTPRSSWHQVSVGGALMRAYVSFPAGTGPFPGVVVAQHRGGVDEFTREMTDRLAGAGFVGVAPDLYHRDGADCRDAPQSRRERLRDATVTQDVNAAVEFLAAHPRVVPDRLGIIGFCMGGRVAYLMAAANPALKAAVAYYGGGIFSAEGDGPAPFERTAGMHCPLLFHFGAEDRNPSPADMARLEAGLATCGKPHEFHAYAGAGHAFMNRHADTYRAEADRISWPRTVAFLAARLAAPVTDAATGASAAR